jgi:hypothetical protein
MLKTRTWLLGLFPLRPIVRIGCRPTPAECGPDRPAAPERKIASARTTRLHASAVLGPVRVYSWSEMISGRASRRPRCASWARCRIGIAVTGVAQNERQRCRASVGSRRSPLLRR